MSIPYQPQIEAILAKLEQTIQVPCKIFDDTTDQLLIQCNALQELYIQLLDDSSMDAKSQRAIIQQVYQVVGPIEQKYKQIEFFERLCEMIESAVIQLEEIVQNKTKSLFKRQLTEIELKDRKNNIQNLIKEAQNFLQLRGIKATPVVKSEPAVSIVTEQKEIIKEAEVPVQSVSPKVEEVKKVEQKVTQIKGIVIQAEDESDE
ncbi:Hypothetical_protein [Hexamita inflata]|uniref:Hypothetical_protein n=1 Tax=Hexamita inflata TaxID=28002 RepID=A0ABP1HGP0_9EUKA